MRLFSQGTRLSTIETAALLDPGEYRIQLHLARAYVARGNCARARSYARRAHGLYPNAPEPRHLLAACGERVRSQ